MRPLGACGRADLVRALASGDPHVIASTAEMLGYGRPTEKKKSPRAVSQATESAGELAAETKPKGPQLAPYSSLVVPFWRVDAYASIQVSDAAEIPLDPGEVRWDSTRPNEPPTVHPKKSSCSLLIEA